MAAIDPSARVAPEAKIGEGVTIGPFCVVGPDVTLEADVKLLANVHVTGHTTIGARTIVYPFASLGTPPQSVKYRGGPTRLVVGADCDIREGVTMNTGTEEDRGVTEVGDRCFLMVGSHVGHDCRVGSRVVMANNTVLGGHVNVGDNVVFGGQAAIHQFVTIGEGAMIAGVTGVAADVIPFGFVIGQRGHLEGLNVVGLRRRGLSRADIQRLRALYHALFLGEGQFKDRFAQAERDFADHPYTDRILAFIRAKRPRPLMQPLRTAGAPQAPSLAADLPS
jgi:UDP-N-acetylglucosamine acyltransferase